MDKNHKIYLNKIFTGSFLSYGLGHELINFIMDDNKQRYVYLNALGERSETAALNTKYVFHIIESSKKNEKGIFELVAVSEVEREEHPIYHKDCSKEIIYSPKFMGHTFHEIFDKNNMNPKTHQYSFKASNFYRVKHGKRVIIKVNRSLSSFSFNNDEYVIEIMSNPKHSISIACENEAYSDVKVLEQVFNDELMEKVNDNINLLNIDDELPFSVISDRTNLEDSTSNQIEYFLNRDKNLCNKFIKDFLGVSIDDDELFEIVREKESNIDLLFKSKKRVIVIENKIDSGINGIKENKIENKIDSQLNKYYNYVSNKYASTMNNNKFFILTPEYNDINLDEFYNGEKFSKKTYNNLFGLLKNTRYHPNGITLSEISIYSFNEFKKSIEYLTWSKGMQAQNTAYIRLKQRLNELGVFKKGKVIKLGRKHINRCKL